VAWQREFIKTFYDVVRVENAVFAKFRRGLDADVSYPSSAVDLNERQWQCLLFKGILANGCFSGWIIRLEQAYSESSRAQSRNCRSDFTLARAMKRGKPDWKSQITIEMKRGFGGAARDYRRLRDNCDPGLRGLLVYRFRKRPVDLEREADKLSAFKRARLIRTTLGDMAVSVAGVGGSQKKYHFGAVLFSW
jgi:hypothetical protein